jgi:pimeloyl-ACP methyl ester carboxylesterase
MSFSCRARWLSAKLLLMVLVVGTIFGCAKPKGTLVVVVGGLGLSQLGDVRRAVEKNCPDCDVVNAGGWDGYKADLEKIATEKKRQHVIMVGHSFGCGAIAETAEKLPKLDLAVFIDPAWDDFKLPRTVGKYLWFKRSGFGIEREARIIGARQGAVTIQGGHNDIPHSDVLIAGVVHAVRQVNAGSGTPVGGKVRQGLGGGVGVWCLRLGYLGWPRGGVQW